MSKFRKGDVVIANGHDYCITDNENPCIVVATYEDEVLRRMPEVNLNKGCMIVSTLKRSLGESYDVRERLFDKIDARYVDIDSELKDSLCIYKNLPKGTKCKIISVLDSSWKFAQRFGDIVVYIPRKNIYMITSKNLVKCGELL